MSLHMSAHGNPFCSEAAAKLLFENSITMTPNLYFGAIYVIISPCEKETLIQKRRNTNYHINNTYPILLLIGQIQNNNYDSPLTENCDFSSV